MKTETERYARQCDVTGEGMNEGYCIQDGLMYIKHEKDLLKHLREVEKDGNPEYDTLVAEGRLTDEFLLDEYYDEEYYLWTEWYEDIEYAGNMEIIESNKLIAEFMGMEDYQEMGEYVTPRYHTSWNWLMPVVERIEEIAIDDTNLTIKDHRYQFDMGYTQCNIYDHVKDCLVASGDMGSKLLSTHQAVVEFINQYKK